MNVRATWSRRDAGSADADRQADARFRDVEPQRANRRATSPRPSHRLPRFQHPEPGGARNPHMNAQSASSIKLIASFRAVKEDGKKSSRRERKRRQDHPDGCALRVSLRNRRGARIFRSPGVVARRRRCGGESGPSAGFATGPGPGRRSLSRARPGHRRPGRRAARGRRPFGVRPDDVLFKEEELRRRNDCGPLAYRFLHSTLCVLADRIQVGGRRERRQELAEDHDLAVVPRQLEPRPAEPAQLRPGGIQGLRDGRPGRIRARRPCGKRR